MTQSLEIIQIFLSCCIFTQNPLTFSSFNSNYLIYVWIKFNFKIVWPVWPLSSLITRRRRLQMKEEMRIKILHRHTDRTKISWVHINKKERRNRFPIQEAKIFLPKPVRWNDEVDPCSKWRARFFRWNELGFYFVISHYISRYMMIRSRKSFMCQFERVPFKVESYISPWYEL